MPDGACPCRTSPALGRHVTAHTGRHPNPTHPVSALPRRRSVRTPLIYLVFEKFTTSTLGWVGPCWLAPSRRRCYCRAQIDRVARRRTRMQIAERLKRIPPYLFMELRNKIAQARASGVDVISLAIGDPVEPTPEPVID